MKQAIILCGGIGSRLKPLTDTKPKCLIEISGKPIIDHILDQLTIHGIDKIMINLHHMPEQIIFHVKDKAIYSYEPVLLGHHKTIQYWKPWILDDFWVINGDTISDISFTWMINQHKEGSITAAMDEYRSVGAWLYPFSYLTNPNVPIYPYRQSGIRWYDCGNPDRLKAAKEYYERPIRSMNEL